MAAAATRAEKRQQAADANWKAHMARHHGMVVAFDGKGYVRKSTDEELHLSTAERIEHGYANHIVVEFTQDELGRPLPRRATLSSGENGGGGTPEMRGWFIDHLDRVGPKQPREEDDVAECGDDGRDWVTVQMAARALHLGYKEMYRAVQRGQIRSRRLGRTLQIPVADFLAELPKGGYNQADVDRIADRLQAMIAEQLSGGEEMAC